LIFNRIPTCDFLSGLTLNLQKSQDLAIKIQFNSIQFISVAGSRPMTQTVIQ